MPYTTNEGVQIYYEVEGSDPPLVLHIGFRGSLDDWRREDTRYTETLRDTYQLILLDPRGQGRSDKPHDPDAYTGAARAGGVLAVLDDLDVARAHFWGYSMGGSAGFTLVARVPDRLLSLIAGGANPYWELADPTDHVLYRQFLLGMDGFVAAWERDFCPLPKGARERWLAEDAGALTAALLAPQRPQDVTGALPSIHVPTLLYVGTEDNPDPVKRAAGVMPNATFVALDELDHAQGFRRADLILPHVRSFLDRINRSPTVEVEA